LPGARATLSHPAADFILAKIPKTQNRPQARLMAL
jgi:hypothetical protein